MAVIAAAVVVGLTTSAAPTFLASARDAALEGRIDGVTPTDLGATVQLFSEPSPTGIDAIDVALTDLLEGLPGLGSVDRTMMSTRLGFTVEDGGEGRGRLLARTGAM